MPAFSEDFDAKALAKASENVCLGLKFKLPKWERFLFNKEKQKCLRYRRLEEFVYEYIKKGGN